MRGRLAALFPDADEKDESGDREEKVDLDDGDEDSEVAEDFEYEYEDGEGKVDNLDDDGEEEVHLGNAAGEVDLDDNGEGEVDLDDEDNDFILSANAPPSAHEVQRQAELRRAFNRQERLAGRMEGLEDEDDDENQFVGVGVGLQDALTEEELQQVLDSGALGVGFGGFGGFAHGDALSEEEYLRLLHSGELLEERKVDANTVNARQSSSDVSHNPGRPIDGMIVATNAAMEVVFVNGEPLYVPFDVPIEMEVDDVIVEDADMALPPAPFEMDVATPPATTIVPPLAPAGPFAPTTPPAQTGPPAPVRVVFDLTGEE
jgi:hypothetical protein